jgi:hypothetical protein
MDEKKLHDLLTYFIRHAYISLPVKNIRFKFKRYLFRHYSDAITYMESFMNPKYKIGGGYIIRDDKNEKVEIRLARRIYDDDKEEPVCIIFKRYKNLDAPRSDGSEITDVIIIQFVDF